MSWLKTNSRPENSICYPQMSQIDADVLNHAQRAHCSFEYRFNFLNYYLRIICVICGQFLLKLAVLSCDTFVDPRFFEHPLFEFQILD